jgi:hypothetical protein
LTESRTTGRFWDAFADLPDEVKQEAKAACRLFRNNPAHSSLRFKKLEGEDHIYSVRIGVGYRALGAMKGNRMVWFWIGSHADYDRKV